VLIAVELMYPDKKNKFIEFGLAKVKGRWEMVVSKISYVNRGKNENSSELPNMR